MKMKFITELYNVQLNYNVRKAESTACHLTFTAPQTEVQYNLVTSDPGREDAVCHALAT